MKPDPSKPMRLVLIDVKQRRADVIAVYSRHLRTVAASYHLDFATLTPEDIEAVRVAEAAA